MTKPHEQPKPTHRAICPLCRQEGIGTLIELTTWTGTHFQREHPRAGSVPVKVKQL